MTQITIQGYSGGSPVGLAIPVEVSSFDVSRKAKMRTYQRVQAFSDTALIVGSENPVYTFTLVIPQDFGNGDNIENVMYHLHAQDLLFRDIEGNASYIRVTDIKPHYVGGVVMVYTVDVEGVYYSTLS